MHRRPFDLALDAWSIMSRAMSSDDLHTIERACQLASLPEVRASARHMQDSAKLVFSNDRKALIERWHEVV